MKSNKLIYLPVAIILMFIQGHLAQKLGMLQDYFANPEYEFFTTFSFMDLFDLFLHGGLPLIIIGMVVADFLKKKPESEPKT